MTVRPSSILDVQGARPLNERLRNFRGSRGWSHAARAAEPGVNRLCTRQVGALVFPIAQRYVAAAVLVTLGAIQPPNAF